VFNHACVAAAGSNELAFSTGIVAAECCVSDSCGRAVAANVKEAANDNKIARLIIDISIKKSGQKKSVACAQTPR